MKDLPDDWPLSLQPIYVVSDGRDEFASIVNTSKTQEPPIFLIKVRSFSKCVRFIAFCLRLKYRSQSKNLLIEELNRAEESSRIQKKHLSRYFSVEKKVAVKLKKVEIYQNLHYFLMEKELSDLRAHQTCQLELRTTSSSIVTYETRHGNDLVARSTLASLNTIMKL